MLGEIAVAEPLAAPLLAGLLVIDSEDLRQAAAYVVGQLVDQVLPEDFVQFDEACRNEWSCETASTSAWRRLKPSDVSRLGLLPRAAACVGLASCHGNGYVREAAVNELANVTDGTELPFLLLRLNDWVRAVRESALAPVLHRIIPGNLGLFLEHSALVARLRICGRGEHECVLSEITALLRRPEGLPQLEAALHSASRPQRREAMKLLADAPWPDSKPIFETAAGSRDATLRLWACRRLVRELDVEALQAWALKLVRDSFMPVRRESLQVLAERFPAEARSLLLAALADGHASVREVARHWLHKWQPEFSFPDHYRNLLLDKTPRAAAILGLGETGNAGDARLLVPHLTSSTISVRKAAMRAVAALDGDAYAGFFLANLADGHPGISHEAVRALRHRTPLVAMHLPPLLAAAQPAHVRRNAFKLSLGQPFWERGAFLLKALRDDDAQIAQMARRAFHAWLIRSRSMGLPPSTRETERFKEQLAQSAGSLSRREIELLELTLRTLG
jgi:HEAT repeat protein